MGYHSLTDKMLFRHHIRIDEQGLPKEAYEEICALAPEARKHYGFHLQLDIDVADGGEIVRRIIDICSEHGLKWREAIGKGVFGYRVDRSYGDDLFQFDLLMLNPQKMTRAGVKDGRFVGAVDDAWRIISELGFSARVVVDEEARGVLEEGNFVGLQFSESQLYPKRLGALTADEWVAVESASRRLAVLPGPFWELKSSIVMPKMASRLMQYGWRGEPPRPFEGDYSRPVFIDDAPFSRGEVHYRRGEIDTLGSFDIARTFENYVEPRPALVISQRFYQYCLANGIGLWVDPVRIDSE